MAAATTNVTLALAQSSNPAAGLSASCGNFGCVVGWESIQKFMGKQDYVDRIASMCANYLMSQGVTEITPSTDSAIATQLAAAGGIISLPSSQVGS